MYCIFKSIFAFFLTISIPSEEGWVSVSRTQRVPIQLEEEDASVWVVFSKSFGREKLLIKFPKDPSYQKKNGIFLASSPCIGNGEISLLVKNISGFQEKEGRVDYIYPDPDNLNHWIRERHITTSENHYVLRFSHVSGDAALFSKFVESFEVEKVSDFIG